MPPLSLALHGVGGGGGGGGGGGVVANDWCINKLDLTPHQAELLEFYAKRTIITEYYGIIRYEKDPN